MPKTIQIRLVSDQLYQRLATRAAASGMSLSAYLRKWLEQLGGDLTSAEFRRCLAALEPVQVRETAAAAVRAARDSR